MSQFKVGQKVRVVKHAEGIALDFADWNQSEKRQFPIGSTATITAIDGDGAIFIIGPEGDTADTLNPESFEPVEENMNFNAEEAIKQLQALGYTVTEPEFKLGQIWESDYGDHYLVCRALVGEPFKCLLYNIRSGMAWASRPVNKPSEYGNACEFKLYANNISQAIEKGLKF